MRMIMIVGLLVFSFVRIAGADSSWNSNLNTTNARADITGDGKPETIELRVFTRTKNNRLRFRCFRLTINGQTIYARAPGPDSVEEFRFANIDKRDKFKEVVVTSAGYNGSA
jgi:hypothetical protein